MNNARMTIKELADSLGVSKTTVRKYMDEDFRAKYTEKGENGVIFIVQEGCARIAETTANIPQTPQFTANQFSETPQTSVSSGVVALLQATIDTLQQQLATKDAQLATKDAQIANLQQLLDQEQKLHLRTQQAQLPAPNDVDAPGDVAADAEPEDVRPRRSWSIFKRREK